MRLEQEEQREVLELDAVVQEKVRKILVGELKYSSTNLAFNMLISKLQNKLKSNTANIESCMKEIDEFLTKYPVVAKVDMANIAAL